MRAFSFLLVFLCACKPGLFPLLPTNAYKIVIQGEPPLEALDAVADWTANVPVTFTFATAPGPSNCPNCVYVTLATSAASEAACFGAKAESGCTIALPLLSNSSAVWIAQDIAPSVQAWAWRHELGHAMGLFHDVPGTVMRFSHLDASPTVTPRDARQWLSARGR